MAWISIAMISRWAIRLRRVLSSAACATSKPAVFSSGRPELHPERSPLFFLYSIDYNPSIVFDAFLSVFVSGSRKKRNLLLAVAHPMTSPLKFQISTSTLRKYTGPVDIWLSVLFSLSNPRGKLYCSPNSILLKIYLAMAEQESQWVWYASLRLTFGTNNHSRKQNCWCWDN